MTQSLIWAALGTGFAFLMTVSGAATVFLFRKKVNEGFQKIFLGFASGIMIAASVWSLIIPAIEQAKLAGGLPWIPAAAGFLAGGLFLMAVDSLFDRYRRSKNPSGLLVFAVTLHNIPEGMAVGVVYAGWLTGNVSISASAALALALGIAIQNFPEGAIISMPLRANGMSKFKACLQGILSGIVEPVAGLLTILLASVIIPFLPYLLSFAAGAMLYVVVEELIPEMSEGRHSNLGTITFMLGFSLMMILDVALG